MALLGYFSTYEFCSNSTSKSIETSPTEGMVVSDDIWNNVSIFVVDNLVFAQSQMGYRGDPGASTRADLAMLVHQADECIEVSTTIVFHRRMVSPIAGIRRDSSERFRAVQMVRVISGGSLSGSSVSLNVPQCIAKKRRAPRSINA